MGYFEKQIQLVSYQWKIIWKYKLLLGLVFVILASNLQIYSICILLSVLLPLDSMMLGVDYVILYSRMKYSLIVILQNRKVTSKILTQLFPCQAVNDEIYEHLGYSQISRSSFRYWGILCLFLRWHTYNWHLTSQYQMRTRILQ